MRLSTFRRLAGATLAVFTLAATLPATASAQGEPPPPPPYLMKNMDAVFVSVTWDPATIDALLPDGLTPLEGYTGGINIYSVPKGYGLAPFTAAFAYVDVDNYLSSSGIPGRYILDGVFGPEAVAEAVNRYYGWPMRDGLGVLLADENVLTAMAQRNGEPLITAKLTEVALDCADFSGSIKYVTPADEGKVSVLEVPFSAQLCPGKLIDSVEISAPEEDPISRLKIDKAVQAFQVRDASFSYGRPELR